MARQGRGHLTDRIKEKSKELMGREISTRELRLMPYALTTMIDSPQRIDPRRINQEERGFLSLWREAGYMEGGASGMQITREFWDILCEIVFLGYVDLFEEEPEGQAPADELVAHGDKT